MIKLLQCLVPQLQPGDVIVIDDASFHHPQTIAEIVAQAGCEIWFRNCVDAAFKHCLNGYA